MKTGNANVEQVQKQGEVSVLCKLAKLRRNAQKEGRCGVVIWVAEFAEEVRLAIPDFRAYKTSCLRGVPRGVSRNGIARSKGIETAGFPTHSGSGTQTPQRHRPLKGH